MCFVGEGRMADRDRTDEEDSLGDKESSWTPKFGHEHDGRGTTGVDDISRRWWTGAWDQS